MAGRGYCPVPPEDRRHTLRASMLRHMEALGLPVEKHHHEVGACQHELGLRYGTLRQAADWCLTYKYVVKNLAHANGVTATFLPKPMPLTSGSGMHVHMSFWVNGRNTFFDEGGEYAQLSKEATFAIGGILNHAHALLAITNPTTNSYKRLVPGYEAPCCLAFSQVSCYAERTNDDLQQAFFILSLLRLRWFVGFATLNSAAMVKTEL